MKDNCPENKIYDRINKLEEHLSKACRACSSQIPFGKEWGDDKCYCDAKCWSILYWKLTALKLSAIVGYSKYSCTNHCYKDMDMCISCVKKLENKMNGIVPEKPFTNSERDKFEEIKRINFWLSLCLPVAVIGLFCFLAWWEPKGNSLKVQSANTPCVVKRV